MIGASAPPARWSFWWVIAVKIGTVIWWGYQILVTILWLCWLVFRTMIGLILALLLLKA